MDIKDIINQDNASSAVSALKNGRGKDMPPIEEYKKQWDVNKHDTFDRAKLKDRVVVRDGEPTTQPVNRIGVPFQKNIVNKAVSFAFGSPVLLNADYKSKSNEEKIYNAVIQCNKDNKINSFNRRFYRELLRSSEVAELWYNKDLKAINDNYGFQTNKEVCVALFSPFNGDELYPYFDEFGDMVAFSRQYILKNVSGQSITHFDTYTDDFIISYRMDGSGWLETERIEHGLGKIPVVYASSETVDWADAQNSINRLEFLLSKFGETNDYHAAPILFINGKVKGMPEKGESGKVMEGDKDTKLDVVSWDHAPESIKLEIDTLIRFIYSMTQTPDVSFESVKGLGSISGVALEMLFMDAHLKVQEKKEILDEYLQRRVNIQKTMLGKLGNLEKEARTFEIEPEIVPYKINDETTLINNLVTAVAGGLISQKTGIKTLKWVDDPEVEMLQILEEQKQKASFELFEPTDS